jgi:RHS repeat-associated protein
VIRMTGRGFACLLAAFTLLAIISPGIAAAYVIIGGTPPAGAPAPGELYTDLGQGLFEWSHTDFNIAGPMPIVMTRVYRSKDWDSNHNFIVRPFGIGFNLNYNMYLYSRSEAAGTGAGTGYTDAEIVLPDGGQIVCNRTSSCSQNNCSDYTDAVFQCTSSPDATFFGAQITYDAGTPGWDVTLKTQKVYSFGLGAPLQSIHDRYGNSTTLVRSGGQNGRISQIISSTGRYINFSYADSANSNLITEATDDSGRNYNYSYDTNNRLTSVTEGLGIYPLEGFGYGTSNQMGDITQISQALSALATYTTNIQYGNTYNSVSEISTPSGNWTYNPTFSGSGQMQNLKITDPNNIKRQYFFNSSGYLTKDIEGQSLSLAETTSYTRDPNTNHILSITDNINRVTSYVYDSLGNITNVTRLSGTPNAVTTNFSYGACGQLASITDPLGHAISATFDSNCNAITVTDQTGNLYNLQYNSGRLTSIQDPLQNLTQLGYSDSANDLTSVEDPLGNTTSLSYDSIGRLTGARDPLRNSTAISYDYMDDLIGVIDANGNPTTYNYDPLQDFLGWKDANGNSTIITYTASVGSIEVGSGAGGVQTYMLDPLGNVTSYTDKRGLTSALTYDSLNRLTQIKYNSSGNLSFPRTTVNYTYDSANRVTQIADTGGGSPSSPGNTQTFVYDLLDRVTSWTSPEGAVSYSYDNAGRRLTMQAGTQAQVNYCYDAANRLLTLTSGGTYQCPSPNPTVTIAYDQDGRRQSLALPNGVSVGYYYDADSRISSLVYTSVAAGNLGSLTYSYDADDRIVQLAGNLDAVNLPAAVSSATYNSGNQLTAWSGTNIGSDQANNLSNDPTLPTPGSATWNERNQLSSVNAQGAQNFLYDALGRRESEYGSIPTATFLYDTLTPVRTTTASGNADLLAMPGTGEVFTRTDSSGTMVPLHDALGSTIALVNGAGAINTQYTYQPFGQSSTTGTANSNPFRFAGMEYDSTGLYHTLARYYSPGLQRFLSEDPLGIGGGDTNIFAYVSNNPVNMTDPLGLSAGGGGGGGGGGCENGECGPPPLPPITTLPVQMYTPPQPDIRLQPSARPNPEIPTAGLVPLPPTKNLSPTAQRILRTIFSANFYEFTQEQEPILMSQKTDNANDQDATDVGNWVTDKINGLRRGMSGGLGTPTSPLAEPSSVP